MKQISRVLLAVAMCSCRAQTICCTPISAADWYVNSINGSDSNTGLSPSQAFQTLTHLQAQSLLSGQTVALATGSIFHEQMTVPVNSFSVVPYGTGGAPLVDGSTAISAGAWTKTGGLTNTYQVSLTLPTSAASAWENVWENGNFLTNETSSALVDANPGSYFATANTGAITLFVQASSGNPTSNGKTYEYAAQLDSIQARLVSNTRIIGIRTRRSILSQGSISLGPNSFVYLSTAEDGGIHNIYALHDSIIANTTVSEAYCGAGCGPILFVGYDDSVVGSQNAASLQDSVLAATSKSLQPLLVTGFDSHTSDSTRHPLAVFVGSTISGMGQVGGSSNVGTLLVGSSIKNRTTIAVPAGSDMNMFPISTATQIWNTDLTFDHGCISCSAFVDDINKLSITISGVTVTGSGGIATLTGFNGGFQSGSDISIIGSTFTGVGMPVVLLAADAVVTLTGNSYVATTTQVYNLSGIPLLLNSNFNAFNSAFTSAILGGTTYHSLAAWQTGTGQDLNSTP